MSKTKRLIGLCLAVLCSQGIYAQPQVMSLEELFRLADENSRSIQIHDIGKQIADEALAAAKAQRLPEVSASLSAGYLGNGRMWDRDFSNGVQAPMPHFSNNFALEARQVIYAGGAVDSGIEMAALDSRSAELDRERSRQDVRFLLVGCYLDLYRLHNQIRVLQQNISLTEQLIAHMEARNREGNREGAALKNDITRYELQRETQRLQLTQAENARAITNYRLATTLHLPAGTEILPDTAALSRSFPAYAEEEWQAEAIAHNLDLQQARLRILRNEQQVRSGTNSRYAANGLHVCPKSPSWLPTIWTVLSPSKCLPSTTISTTGTSPWACLTTFLPSTKTTASSAAQNSMSAASKSPTNGQKRKPTVPCRKIT